MTVAQQTKVLTPVSTLSAIDSTGMEAGHTSRYFVRRKHHTSPHVQSLTYRRFPKLALVCDCASHLITGLLPSRGPTSDVTHFKQLLQKASIVLPITTITADAGYDSESNHVYAREVLAIHSIINPRVGRPSTKLPTGHYRREMVTNFDRITYGQHWQVETVMFMLKKNLSEEIAAQSYWSQCRELSLKALTHNILILV